MAGLIRVILIWCLILLLLSIISVILLIQSNISINGRYLLRNLMDAFWWSLVGHRLRPLVDHLKVLLEQGALTDGVLGDL